MMPPAPTFSDHPRLIAHPTEPIRGEILDADGTLYVHQQYHAHTNAVDDAIIAQYLGVPVGEVKPIIHQHRLTYGRVLGLPAGQPARLTQTLVHHLGMPPAHWHQRRADGYQPERYLEPDAHLTATLHGALERGVVAIGSNSPEASVRRIVSCLVTDRALLRRLAIFGADTVGTSKPDDAFFRSIVQALGLRPGATLSIGNEPDNDAEPAILAGMGAGVIQHPRQIPTLERLVTTSEHLRPLETTQIDHLLRQLHTPGHVRVVGVVGRAGAGKSTITQQLKQRATTLGLPAATIGLDALFRLSSPERATWLKAEDVPAGDERTREQARRSDQHLWWDFELGASILEELRRGRSVHLNHVYDQANKGLKTGRLDIEPDVEAGTLVFMEGVGVAELAAQLDAVIYVNAHETVRRGRVYDRDVQKRGPEEAMRRWRMTQAYEGRLFGPESPLRSAEAPPTIAVIDNSLTAERTEDAQLRTLAIGSNVHQALPER